MKIAIVGILFLSVSPVLSSNSRVGRDGSVEIAVAKVGDVICWTEEEKDDAIAKYEMTKATSPYTVIMPDKFEIAISTTIQFTNLDEFRNVMTSKPAIVEKIIELNSQVMSLENLGDKYPQYNVTGKIRKLTQKIDLLISLYESLP